jgi:hypothetical protein
MELSRKGRRAVYIMLALILGSVLIGCATPLSQRGQTWVAIVAATAATLVYFVSQRAM